MNGDNMSCVCNNPEHYHPTPSPREQELQFATEMVQAAERALKNARDELARVRRETFPEEPANTIIEFSLAFTRNGRRYDYAARKVNTGIGGPARWYVTGEGTHYTWKELVRFIESKYILAEPRVVVTGDVIRGFYGVS